MRKVKREKILLEARNETKSFECEDSIVVKIEQKEKQLKKKQKMENLKAQSLRRLVFEHVFKSYNIR